MELLSTVTVKSGMLFLSTLFFHSFCFFFFFFDSRGFLLRNRVGFTGKGFLFLFLWRGGLVGLGFGQIWADLG